jgi:hypothetical protein
VRELVDQILLEYDSVRDPAGDPELEALKAAVFVEDVFGIVLSDDEIDPEQLGSSGAMRAFVIRRLGAN